MSKEQAIVKPREVHKHWSEQTQPFRKRKDTTMNYETAVLMSLLRLLFSFLQGKLVEDFGLRMQMLRLKPYIACILPAKEEIEGNDWSKQTTKTS